MIVPQFILITCKGREETAQYIKDRVPGIKISFDNFQTDDFSTSAYKNFQNAWKMAGNQPTVILEDDIILTSNFVPKILKAINERPDTFIQFFSMRKADIEIGSRWDNNYLMNQCHYMPAGFGAALYEYSFEHRKGREKNPLGADTCIKDFMKSRKIKYWIHVPSLVEHRVMKSAADPRRSSKRQSKTFKL